MKRIAALLFMLIFSNLAVAHPFDSGGGSSSSSEETDLTMIILVTVVAGVGALLISDIISDNKEDTRDALSGDAEESAIEDTGVNWGQLNDNVEGESIPVLAVSVFPGSNGRELANYFSNLIVPGNNLYYNIYSSPVSFGGMSPAEAAATGFSFLDCQWFLTADSAGLELHSENAENPLWLFNTAEWDSAMVREASSSFLEFFISSGE